MKCQILFSWKNITNLSSAEFAQRVVMVKYMSSDIQHCITGHVGARKIKNSLSICIVWSVFAGHSMDSQCSKMIRNWYLHATYIHYNYKKIMPQN